MAIQTAAEPDHPISDGIKLVTNLVRRPVDGRTLTASGRNIPAPPWIMPEDPASLADYDRWLFAQSHAEAVDLGDDLILARLEEYSERGMDRSMRDLLHHFLFGVTAPEFEARQDADDVDD